MYYIYLPWHGSTYSFCQSSLQNIPSWYRLKDNHDRYSRPISITYLTFTTSRYSFWIFTDLYLVHPTPVVFCGFFFTQRACKVIKQVRQNLTRWSPYSSYCFTGVQRNLLFSPFINLFTNYESPHCSMESKNLLGELITGFQHPVNCAVSPQDVIF